MAKSAEAAKSNEKEVYVDFSSVDEEEIIEEDVVQSGPTAENSVPPFIDKLQSHLPPAAAEAVDNLVASYHKNRKAYLLALGAVLILLVVVVIAAFVLLSSGDSSSSPSMQTTTFRVGPYEVPPYNGIYNFHVDQLNISRPLGSIAVQQLTIRLVDEDDVPIAPRAVMVADVAIRDSKDQLIAQKTYLSRGMPPLDLPAPYAVMTPEDRLWHLSADLVNVWGLLANAPAQVYIQYNVTWSDAVEDHTAVSHKIVGNVDGTDDIRPECSTKEEGLCKFPYESTWDTPDATIVAAAPYYSIGAQRMTLEDLSGEEPVRRILSTASYDDAGYIRYSEVDMNTFSLQQNKKIRVTSYYDNAYPYQNVYTQFCLWGTFDDTLKISPSNTPTRSFSPTPSVSPTPMVTMTPSVQPTVNGDE